MHANLKGTYPGIRAIKKLALSTLMGGIRDRLIRGLVLVGLLLIASTSVFSSFSMRQPLEMAINYTLSVINIFAIVLSLFLGLNLISRELESRENYFVLAQPVPRSTYIMGKYGGFVLIIATVIVILTLFSVLPLMLIAVGEGHGNLSLANMAAALVGIFFSCSILGAVTLLFTSIATSGILPFLMSIAVYAIGVNTQPVKRFLESGMAGEKLVASLRVLVDAVYYIFPNFSLLDYKLYAIYGLPFSMRLFLLSILYGTLYSGVCLFFAITLFEKRDML